MLRNLYGQVLQVRDGIVVLDVNGLGFEAHCSRRAAEACVEGEMARIQTYLLVSESGPSLFGFADDEERAHWELGDEVQLRGRRRVTHLAWPVRYPESGHE